VVEDFPDHGARYGILLGIYPQYFVEFFDFWGFLWYRFRIFKARLVRMNNLMFIRALEGS